MTAADVAGRLRARPAGAGRWAAKCPSHNDHSPSLSIRDGSGGRVVVHCFAGCPTGAVLSAAGLTWRDIMGAPTSPEERDRMRREREAREASEAVQHEKRLAVRVAAEAVQAHADRLAVRLAALTWGDATPAYAGEAPDLAAQYHSVLDAMREAAA